METYKITYKTKEGAIITIEDYTIVDHVKSYIDLVSRGEIELSVELIKE